MAIQYNRAFRYNNFVCRTLYIIDLYNRVFLLHFMYRYIFTFVIIVVKKKGNWLKKIQTPFEISIACIPYTYTKALHSHEEIIFP